MIPASVIIIAQNEEKNIGYCLQSLVCEFDDIWLIDSYSADRTTQIAAEHGAKILQNRFVNYGQQRNWALENANLKYDWILYIDADEQVTPAFCRDLHGKISSATPEIGGMTLKVDFIFMGRLLRFSRPSVPMLRVLRRGRANWKTRGSREYGVVQGTIIPIKSKIFHKDRKPLKDWIDKHIKNAILESQHDTLSTDGGRPQNNEARLTHERMWRFWLRSKFWDRFPKFWRTFGYFIYRYLIRGGILDGRAGFMYCFLHALWYPLLIDIMIIEKKIK